VVEMMPTVASKPMIKIGTVAVLFTLFILLLGGSMDPRLWGEQFERRIHPAMLMEPYSQLIDDLDERFEDSFILSQTGESYERIMKITVRMNDTPGTLPDALLVEMVHTYAGTLAEYRRVADNYHSSDHLATTSEVIERGTDNCDGHAVLTASLLRRRGYDAYVVMGYSHVWVEVQLQDRVVSLNNPQGYEVWYCKFNENHVRWNMLPLLMLYMGVFLLSLSLLLISYDLSRESVIAQIIDYGYFLKYIALLLVGFLGFGVLVFAIITTMIL
jgi:hypothetical protein